MELSWGQMERHFNGEPAKPRVVFSTGTRVEKNLELGHNVKTKVPYYAKRFEGIEDYVSHPATQEIIEAFPKEFAAYLEQIKRGNIEPYDGFGEEDEAHCAVPFRR